MSDDYDYFSGRYTSRTYVSKRFMAGDGHPMRIANKVFEPAESIALVRQGKHLVLRMSPGQRHQIKATFYEADRNLSGLTIQKFNMVSGKPSEQHFTFGPDEIARLLNFLPKPQASSTSQRKEIHRG